MPVIYRKGSCFNQKLQPRSIQIWSNSKLHWLVGFDLQGQLGRRPNGVGASGGLGHFSDSRGQTFELRKALELELG